MPLIAAHPVDTSERRRCRESDRAEHEAQDGSGLEGAKGGSRGAELALAVRVVQRTTLGPWSPQKVPRAATASGQHLRIVNLTSASVAAQH